MSFESDLKKFRRKAEERERRVRVGVVTELFKSIQVGSEITGAPGQPVDTGALRDSWQVIIAPISRIFTNIGYAPAVEDNIRGVTFRNHGPHSVKRTIAGYNRVVASVLERVKSEVS